MTDEDGNPLLVRPYVSGDDDSSPTWPSTAEGDRHHTAGSPPDNTETQQIPMAGAAFLDSGSEPREIRPHRAAAPQRRGRVLALAAGGVAGVITLATAGYAWFGPDDRTDTAIAWPPLPALSASPSPSAYVPPPGGEKARPTSPAATGTSATATRPTAPATTGGGRTTAVPVPPRQQPAPPAAPGPEQQAPSAAAEEEPLAAVPEVPRVVVITAASTLCLDLNGGVPQDDNHVQVFSCNGTDAQRWTLETDGTLRVAGMCAQATGDDAVHIVGCDGRASTQWRAGAGDVLVNLSADACLTDPANGVRVGSWVRVEDCAGAVNQRWTLQP